MENKEGRERITCYVCRALAWGYTLGDLWGTAERLAHYRNQWVVTFLKLHYVIPHGKI